MNQDRLHEAANMAENISVALRNNIKTYFKRLFYQSSLCFLELWFSNFTDHTIQLKTFVHILMSYLCTKYTHINVS